MLEFYDEERPPIEPESSRLSPMQETTLVFLFTALLHVATVIVGSQLM